MLFVLGLVSVKRKHEGAVLIILVFRLRENVPRIMLLLALRPILLLYAAVFEKWTSTSR